MNIPYIIGNEKLQNRFSEILDSEDPRDRLYVYRIDRSTGQPIRPAIIKNAFTRSELELLNMLRDVFKGGPFRIIVRRGETMLISGRVDIG